MSIRVHSERALRFVASGVFVFIAAQWVAVAPWGAAGWRCWVFAYATLGALPFLLLAWLGLHGRSRAGWLALGACTASLQLGLGEASYFDASGYESAARTLPAVAALALLGASWLRRETTDWRWRCSSVALGAVLPWVGLNLFMAVSGYVSVAQPWWHAPRAALALLPLAVGGVAMWRGRTWGLLPVALSVPLASVVEVPFGCCSFAGCMPRAIRSHSARRESSSSWPDWWRSRHGSCQPSARSPVPRRADRYEKQLCSAGRSQSC